MECFTADFFASFHQKCLNSAFGWPLGTRHEIRVFRVLEVSLKFDNFLIS